MLFNSIDFVIFLPIVFTIYWLLRRLHVNYQNSLIIISSYVFYAWWDYRFLSLIIFSTVVDFVVGNRLKIASSKSRKKFLLGCSLIANLGLLGFFKYYNFFVESWMDAWRNVGVELEMSTLKIILPVGISFYTFQTLSYTIDIYKNKIKPADSIFQFAAFVAFFPQLVAGPIERAKNLLPQFGSKRDFDTDTAMSGIYLIIWGLFKKMVIADNCAFFVNQIFSNGGNYSSAELFVGAMLFGFQIYGDFSGYSDIAIGVARLFGIKLMTNFSFPYFSRNIAEFWRRWHISLSTWFRDYLYIPLGGSKGNTWQTIRNVFIVFIVSGFWHGANWTFIIWGLLHALLFLPLLVSNRNRTYINTNRISLIHLPQVIMTFALVSIAWIFFRADTVTSAYQYIIDMVSFNGVSLDSFVNTSKRLLFSLFILFSILILLIFEFRAVQKDHKEVRLSNTKAIFITLLICFMGVFKNPSDFIYFQF